MTPELTAALERARNHKMTPQEIFEQRVSFVSEGKDKDGVRKRLIEQCGYPAEASERAAIVARLRARRDEDEAKAAPGSDYWLGAGDAWAIAIAAIERGDHLAIASAQEGG
jgi:hypothetical protein